MSHLASGNSTLMYFYIFYSQEKCNFYLQLYQVQNDTSFNEQLRRNSLFVEQMQAGDSGIESSPSPIALPLHPIIVTSAIDLKNTSSSSSPSTPPHCIQLICSAQVSPTPSTRQQQRRPSSALLHPDHARLFALRQQLASGDQVTSN